MATRPKQRSRPKTSRSLDVVLHATQERYIAPRSQGQITGGVDAIASVDQCRRGNPANGIPTLEKKLRDNRFTLPAR